ncbi:fimbrial protein [Providencia rustigianii]|uniref:fimbrial protein n=1 Tax=Providencia rustigianii TaxID=158850 RepID=UPI000D8D3164|nr:fimbrial protein [Providencia rustigianii]SPY76178.1 Type-1A pilin [Providencia rustigianii]
MKKKLKRFYILISSMVVFYSASINAACVKNPNFSGVNRTLPNVTYTIQFDNTNSYTLGSLKTSSYVSASTSLARTPNDVYCQGQMRTYYLSPWSGRFSVDKVSTNIPGIYLKTYAGGADRVPFAGAIAETSYIMLPSFLWQVDIIKQGNVTQSAAINSGALAEVYQFNYSNNSRFNVSTLYIPANGIRINVVNCSLKNSQSVYNIELGDWYDTQFKNIGDTSTSVDIPIAFTCMAGANIKATVTSSASYVDINTGKLALSGADKATGIAIQLLDKNNSPIKLNTTNSLQNSVPAGDYMFNWKARYIKTADKITPGSANSTATVNIRYE